jgi:MORN repeat variant
MVAEPTAPKVPARRPRWRYFVQFSLRTLLVFMTAAAVACWFFMQPPLREEQLGQTPLRLRRQIRLMKFDPFGPTGASSQLEIMNGQPYVITNVGRWRLFDPHGNLLVDGRYQNDEQHGRWTTYHTNGRKAAEGWMVRGMKEGLWRTWDEEGRVLSEVAYPPAANGKSTR